MASEPLSEEPRDCEPVTPSPNPLRFLRNWNVWIDLALLLLAGFVLLSLWPAGDAAEKRSEIVNRLQPAANATKPTPSAVRLPLPLEAFADNGAFLEEGGQITLLDVGGDPRATTVAQVVALNDKAALLEMSPEAAQDYLDDGATGLRYLPAAATATPEPSPPPSSVVRLPLPLAAFADGGEFLKAGGVILLQGVGDADDHEAAVEATVVEVNEKAALLELPAAAAATIMAAGTPALQYFPLRPTPTTPSTPTPTPTSMGIQIPLPLAAFADGGAFLKPGGLVSLVGIAGGTVQVTTEVRVVELVEGTRPAVLLDVETAAAPVIQDFMAAGTPVFQYIPLPPVP